MKTVKSPTPPKTPSKRVKKAIEPVVREVIVKKVVASDWFFWFLTISTLFVICSFSLYAGIKLGRMYQAIDDEAYIKAYCSPRLITPQEEVEII